MARRVTAFVSVVAALLLYIAPPGYAAANINIGVNGINGSGTSIVPGTACVDSGSGDSWSFNYGPSFAPAGQFTQTLSAQMGFALDFHAEPTGTDPRTYNKGFFGPNGSITITNTRGSVQLRINAGDCSNPTVSFNGQTVSGSGTWSMLSNTGAYRQATGNGTVNVSARVDTATNAPFTLLVQGQVDVLDPAITISATKAEWVQPNDYQNRKLTVTYTVKNTGIGDAFGVKLIGVTPTTGGVTANFPAGTERNVGNIKAGKTQTVKVVYTLAKSNPPCTRVYAGCSVTAQLTFRVPDAMDVPLDPNPVLTATATAPY